MLKQSLLDIVRLANLCEQESEIVFIVILGVDKNITFKGVTALISFELLEKCWYFFCSSIIYSDSNPHLIDVNCFTFFTALFSFNFTLLINCPCIWFYAFSLL